MTHTARWLLWLGLAAVLLVALVLVIAMFRRDLARGVARQSAIHSQTMRTSFGDLEYLLQGKGPVVLVSHGITGGVDQAQGLADTYMGEGYLFIEVSRFGYLRSSMPKDPSPTKQADAFAELMNGLGIERAFVLGNSAGGTAALHFALEHPDRCQGLILIYSIVPGAAAVLPPRLPFSMVFGSSFVYWTSVRLFGAGMLGIFVPKGILQNMPRDSRDKLVDTILLASLPIERRTAGIMFDMFVGNPSIEQGLDYGRIRVPTLIVHAVDDPAPPIEGARLESFLIDTLPVDPDRGRIP